MVLKRIKAGIAYLAVSEELPYGLEQSLVIMAHPFTEVLGAASTVSLAVQVGGLKVTIHYNHIHFEIIIIFKKTFTKNLQRKRTNFHWVYEPGLVMGNESS